MVTIEQKLSLFSKLVQQDIKNEINGKMSLIEEEYNQKQKEHNEAVDKEAKLMVDKAIKKAEIKRTELVSKAKMLAKKQIMSTKEQCVNQCIQRLKERTLEFVKSDSYESYLMSITESLKEVSNTQSQAIIYVTENDCAKYQGKILDKLEVLGMDKNNVQIKAYNNAIIGGIILEITEESIRMDLSIATLIEDHRALIVEQVFEAIEQVGGVSE